MTTEYRIGDCVEVLKEYPENHFDSCVTDPPYGLEFMGKEWDKLNAGKPGNLAFMPSNDRSYKFDGRDSVGGRLSRTAASPTPKKNPRCRRCGRLKTDKEPYRCKCESPDWDTRTREFGWDMQAWHEAWAREVLRVLKPGAYLLAFGGTRTFHRLTCALEDAGFEIRDCLMWLYGSGFPKSLDVSKAIDKANGKERSITRIERQPWHPSGKGATWGENRDVGPDGYLLKERTAPSSIESHAWSGWGTALKPAWEPIILARKPLTGTVAENVLKYGTGGLNIDGTRIDTTPRNPGFVAPSERDDGWGMQRPGMVGSPTPPGRWPANVLLDEEAAKILDEQSGERIAGAAPARASARPGYDGGWEPLNPGIRREFDSGGASRFFYTAKASRSEREAGLGRVPKQESRGLYGDGIQDNRPHTPEGYEYHSNVRNPHPTVKPVDLMRYLIRLVTPPGGMVLDPFLGSGTTLVAARLEGVSAFGIEKEPEYEPIIKGRMNYPTPPVESFTDPSPSDGQSREARSSSSETSP